MESADLQRIINSDDMSIRQKIHVVNTYLALPSRWEEDKYLAKYKINRGMIHKWRKQVNTIGLNSHVTDWRKALEISLTPIPCTGKHVPSQRLLNDVELLIKLRNECHTTEDIAMIGLNFQNFI